MLHLHEPPSNHHTDAKDDGYPSAPLKDIFQPITSTIGRLDTIVSAHTSNSSESIYACNIERQNNNNNNNSS